MDLFRIYFSDEPPSAAVVRDRLKYAHKFRLKGGAKPTEASYIAFGGKREFISILEVVLIYADDTRCQLPTEQTQAEYVAAKTMIGAVGTLKEVINGLPLPISRLNEMQTFSHAFEPPLQVTPPEFFLKPGLCEGIEFTYILQTGYSVSGNLRLVVMCPVVSRPSSQVSSILTYT